MMYENLTKIGPNVDSLLTIHDIAEGNLWVHGAKSADGWAASDQRLLRQGTHPPVRIFFPRRSQKPDSK